MSMVVCVCLYVNSRAVIRACLCECAHMEGLLKLSAINECIPLRSLQHTHRCLISYRPCYPPRLRPPAPCKAVAQSKMYWMQRAEVSQGRVCNLLLCAAQACIQR